MRTGFGRCGGWGRLEGVRSTSVTLEEKGLCKLRVKEDLDLYTKGGFVRSVIEQG